MRERKKRKSDEEKKTRETYDFWKDKNLLKIKILLLNYYLIIIAISISIIKLV